MLQSNCSELETAFWPKKILSAECLLMHRFPAMCRVAPGSLYLSIPNHNSAAKLVYHIILPHPASEDSPTCLPDDRIRPQQPCILPPPTALNEVWILLQRLTNIYGSSDPQLALHCLYTLSSSLSETSYPGRPLEHPPWSIGRAYYF